MALLIGDNFNYQGKKPNFERDSFTTLSAMKAYPETSIEDGHISYCEEDGNHYVFKSSNTINSITGKWRKLINSIILEQATSDTLGGIKIGYVENGKNYPVELDSEGKAYVNVPWVSGTGGGTEYGNATTESDGLMSKEDKQTLDSLVKKVNALVAPEGYEYVLIQKEQ